MSAKRRLIWLCPEFTPYQQVLFEAVASCPDVDLRVEVMMPNAGTHPFGEPGRLPYEWGIADQNQRIDRKLIDRLLAEKHADVVVSSYLRPTLLAAMRALARHRRRFLFWSDVPLPRRVQWNGRFAKRRPLWRELARNRLLRWIYRHAYRVLVTGFSGVTAVVHLGCPHEKAVCFPYWIETNGSDQRERPSQDRCHISGLGQLVHRKGYDLALEAFAKAIAEHGLPEQVRLVLAGAGEAEESLRTRAERLDVAHRVDFPGWLDSQQKRELFARTTAFVHPARWEPYGVVVLEAMAAGVPVLGSDNTLAVLDRVQHGVSGFIHKTGDSKQLGSDMARVLSDPQTAGRLGQRAQETARAWPPERAVEILRNLLWEDR